MARHDEHTAEAEPQPARQLSEDDQEAVEERGSGSPRVVHEVVRSEGEEELDRPAASLLFSGLAAGFAVSASLLAEAFLHMHLPDAPWTELVVSLGYTVGFVIVILGNLQLFTESTITAVLPVATHPTLSNAGRLLRLWAIVFTANMAGTLAVAALMAGEVIIGPEQLAAAMTISKSLLTHGPLDTLLIATPAGFLIASIAWILPNARGSEFWVIVLITYTIAVGGFSHVVAGSAEAWLLMLTGATTPANAIGGLILPALAGNIIGGTGLFTVLAHGQVHEEIEAGR